MWNDLPIEEVASILRQTGGYLVVPIEGDELVIMRREDKIKDEDKPEEVQLGFGGEDEGNEVIDKVNQELGELQHGDTDIDEVDDEGLSGSLNVGPRKKVRFEPLKGDIAPELQE